MFANGFGLAESLHISEPRACRVEEEGGGVWKMLPSAIPTYRRGLEIAQAFYLKNSVELTYYWMGS